MAEGKYVSAIKKGLTQALTNYFASTYVLPIGVPIVTVWLGHAYELPWFYIWLGALAAFAFVTNGLLRLDEWRARRRVDDKLHFQMVRFAKKMNKDGATEKLGIGFQFHNAAMFPIEFVVKSIQTELDGKFPPKKPYLSDRFTVPSGGVGWFDDHVIDIEKPIKDRTAEGTLEFVIEYGRPDKLRHTMQKKFKIYIGFDDNGDAGPNRWNEV